MTTDEILAHLALRGCALLSFVPSGVGDKEYQHLYVAPKRAGPPWPCLNYCTQWRRSDLLFPPPVYHELDWSYASTLPWELLSENTLTEFLANLDNLS